MKASQILTASPLLLLLLLGGCLEPIPFDHPNYPRGNSGSLRSPYNSAPRVNSPQRYNDRWNRSAPGSDYNQRNRDYSNPSEPLPQPKPQPRPKPQPKPEPEQRAPESEPLVDIDPIEESTKPRYEYAIPVQGASNLVVSPFSKEGPYIDVSDLTSGTEIECPKTGKTILVP